MIMKVMKMMMMMMMMMMLVAIPNPYVPGCGGGYGGMSAKPSPLAYATVQQRSDQATYL